MSANDYAPSASTVNDSEVPGYLRSLAVLLRDRADADGRASIFRHDINWMDRAADALDRARAARESGDETDPLDDVRVGDRKPWKAGWEQDPPVTRVVCQDCHESYICTRDKHHAGQHIGGAS